MVQRSCSLMWSTMRSGIMPWAQGSWGRWKVQYEGGSEDFGSSFSSPSNKSMSRSASESGRNGGDDSVPSGDDNLELGTT